MMFEENWNDLRFVLMVARQGGLKGAAVALRVDYSTAFRRLKSAEGRLGVRLFERLPRGGYGLTPAGERAAAAAERMESEADALAREIAGRDRQLSGHLRVTSSETLAYRFLTGWIAVFRQTHPGIILELVVDNRVLSLSRREADVALRPTRPREQELHGRKLADVAWALYASPTLLGDAKPLGSDNLDGLPLIGWDEAAAGVTAAEWLNSRVTQDNIVYRTTSLLNQLAAAKAGIGYAVLPCYLGDSDAELVRAQSRPLAELVTELWIITHADLRRTARVRAFLDTVTQAALEARPLIEGGAAA